MLKTLFMWVTLFAVGFFAYEHTAVASHVVSNFDFESLKWLAVGVGSVNVPTFYVQQFATNVQLLLQQKGSRLRNAVMSGTHVGKQASPVEQIGQIAMQPVTGRFQPKGRVDAPTDRRWVFPNDTDLNQMIDTFDKLRLLVDPKSHFVQDAVYAAGRQLDDYIINAFFGIAKTGETAGTSVDFSTFTGQQVAVNDGASSDVGLTVFKVRKGKKILMANYVDLDTDPIYCAVTATQHDNLLAEIQVVSLDYNDKPALVDGKVERFVGANFIHTERLGVASGDADDRLIPMWAKSGMYLGMWQDMVTDIDQRKDLSGHPWQAYLMLTAGATRLEEKKIVQIACEE